MNLSRSSLSVALAALVLLSTIVVTGASAQARVSGRGSAAVAGTSPVVAEGPEDVAAWLADTPFGRRVVAVAGGAREAIVRGEGPGADGAPAIASDPRGGAIVVASRGDAIEAHLWSRRWHDGVWEPARQIPAAAEVDSAPAIAAGAAGTWVVWLAESRGGAERRLVASRLEPDGWSAPEALPWHGDRPMAPTIAVQADGTVLVAFSAVDRGDAEIWTIARYADGWERARRLTDNDTHDIEPTLAAGPDGTVIAWSTLSGDHYAPAVAESGRRGGFSAPTVLAGERAAHVAIAGTSPTRLVWSEPVGATGYRITGTRRDRDAWRSLGDLGASTSARVGAAGRGRTVRLAVAGSRGVSLLRGPLDDDRPLRSAPGTVSPDALVEAGDIVLPGSYLGFGDSITVGLVRFSGVISYAPPYTDRVRELIRLLTGVEVPMANGGFEGELTAEGLNRLPKLLASHPAVVFVMEGANDAVNHVEPLIAAENVRAMLRLVRESGAIPVVSTVTPRTENNFVSSANDRIDEMNALIRLYSRHEQAILVDQHDAFLFKAHLYSDLLHPNEQGYVYMGDVWFRGIKPFLAAWLEQQEQDLDQERDANLRANRHPVPDRWQ